MASSLKANSLPVSVVLPVLNEEDNLPAALDSVTWATEVFVVDSLSSDRTCTVAKQHGAEVVQFRHESGGPKKKAWALRNLSFSNEWALFLDADERVPRALADEIADVVTAGIHDGYYIDREFVFRGKELRSYRPDWNLRLFKHGRASLESLGLENVEGTGDNEIHEHFVLQGRSGYLKTALLHNDYRGIGPWIDRHNRYATWEAHLVRRLKAEPLRLSLADLGNPISRNRMARRIWVRLPGRPVLRFVIWYLGKRAFRDGLRGAQFSFLMAWYELIISFKLAELADSPEERPRISAGPALPG